MLLQAIGGGGGGFLSIMWVWLIMYHVLSHIMYLYCIKKGTYIIGAEYTYLNIIHPGLTLGEEVGWHADCSCSIFPLFYLVLLNYKATTVLYSPLPLSPSPPLKLIIMSCPNLTSNLIPCHISSSRSNVGSILSCNGFYSWIHMH